jgi:hypothetical protein
LTLRVAVMACERASGAGRWGAGKKIHERRQPIARWDASPAVTNYASRGLTEPGLMPVTLCRSGKAGTACMSATNGGAIVMEPGGESGLLAPN